MKTVAFFIQSDNINILKPYKKDLTILKYSDSPYWTENELAFEKFKLSVENTNLFKYKTGDASGSCVIVKFNNIEDQTEFILQNGLNIGTLNLNRFYYTTHRYLEFKNGDDLIKELNKFKNFHKDFAYLTYKFDHAEGGSQIFSRH